MSKVLEFLKECGVFYVVTFNGDSPVGRPFGAVMEKDGNLYISTGSNKSVYHQCKAYPKMQIIALKAGTRNWIRISGVAEECTDLSMKKLMMETCPVLTKRYESPDDPLFALFQVKITDIDF